jgi:serine/threonine protein kinase
MSSDSQYQVGNVIANKYVIESILDRSTNSQSFLGNENYSEDKVCIKLYYSRISEDYLKSPNFFLQANTVTALQHDNVCRTYEINEDMGRVYMIREFLKGSNFDDWVTSEKENPGFITKGIEILWQACQGLQKMHESGKHLNIHPCNLIVGELGTKLVDWDPRAMTSMEITSYLPSLSLFNCYRAPEIRKDGNTAYPSSDLYSMGALVYRLLLRRHPPEGYEEILSNLNFPELVVNKFLGKALHPQPDDRFQDAESFGNELWELSSALAGIAESGDPPSAPAEPSPSQDETEVDDSGASFTPDPGASASFASEEPGTAPVPEPESPLFAEPEPSPPVPPSPLETPLSQSTMVEGGTGSAPPEPAPIAFQSELEKPPSSEFRPGTDTSKKFSLEDQEYGSLSSQSTEASYSMFGFKGLQQSQTGVSGPPKPKAKNPKLKFIIILAVFALVIVILAALVIKKIVYMDDEQAAVEPKAPAVEQVPVPESEPVPEEELQPAAEPEEEMAGTKAPPAETKPASAPPEKPVSAPEAKPAPAPEAKPAPAQETKTSPPKKYQGNAKVSAQREKQIMEMYENEKWPKTAAACLKMGDDMNDLGRTFEANLVYQHALKYELVTPSEKIHALGALAVTYKKLGKIAEAKSSLQKLLKIDPDNSFARKLMGQL